MSRATLSPEQKHLLALLLAEEGFSRPQIPAIAPKRADGDPRASFAQERLWFLEQLAPGNSFHNLSVAISLQGAVDVGALRAALDEIVRRHESLRTVFEERGGALYQLILPDMRLDLSPHDLAALAAPEREETVRRIVHEQAARPFDLTKGPLIRAAVIRLAQQQYVLALTLHNVAADGWSIGVLIDELTVLHEAFRRHQSSPLPPPPIQYADYAQWQRESLSKAVLQSQLEYWKSQLQGAPERLELPTDRPRSAVQSHRGAAKRFEFSPGLAAKLHALSRQRNVSLFMLLAAAFNVLLHRYSGQADICVGTPIANRSRAELEGLVGLVQNVLVMRVKLSGQDAFDQVLERTRHAAVGAYAHQDLSFEQLVEELNPPRSLSHPPLFQVMLILDPPRTNRKADGLNVRILPTDTGVSRLDLTCSLTESDGHLVGTLEYNTDLFDAQTMAHLAGHLEVLLEAICANPEEKIGKLPMLAEAERRRILVEWNSTAAYYPKDKALHQLFEEQVRRTPEATALVFEGQALSYRELNARANRLAYLLREQGVGPEVLVGLCVERSLEMLVGFLGILKAGGAYVPLDPGYPLERLAYMLEDAQPRMLLTQEHLLHRLPPLAHIALFCLDRDVVRLAAYPDTDPPNWTRPDNLIYIIYTSGSTGKPKGAANIHRGIVNRMVWQKNAFPLVATDRVLQKTPISFDVSGEELYWPLLCGATLVIARPEGHKDPAYLAEVISAQAITTVHFVPSMLEVLLGVENVGTLCGSLKRVICSGEALSYSLQQKFFSVLQAELDNLYGPTETSIEVSYWHCRSSWRSTTVPIGRPTANTQLYILDGFMNPQPVGVPGELYIGGDCVGRGYLNQPELTAERFVGDSFSANPHAKLYRTGDLARYLPDGNIEYLGRRDQQVKVRGFRIELGEIESALLESPLIAQAVVIAREEASGDKRLIAYVVGRSPEEPDIEVLRSMLTRKLPEYMMPATFVCLGALPLTPNGKVDRQSLGAMKPPAKRTQARYIAPRTAVEQALAEIWATVLAAERVGTDDNFFQLGGHSLLAAQLIARVKKRFDVEMPLRRIFDAPTVATMARLIEAGPSAADRRSPLVEIQPRGSRPPLFLTHPLSGAVFCYSDLARHLGADQPVCALQAPGLEGESEPHGGIREMAEHYVDAILAREPRGPYYLAGWSFGGIVAYEIAQQLNRRQRQIKLLAVLDSYPFDGIEASGGTDETALLAWFVRHLLGASDTENVFDERKLRLLTFEQQLVHVLKLAIDAGALPPQARVSDLQIRFQVARANTLAWRSYVPQAFPGHLTLFISEGTLQKRGVNGDLPWRDLVSGCMEANTVPGNHYTMLSDPNVRHVADRLARCLSNSATATP